MSKQTIARFAGFAAGATMLVGFAAPAGAQTIAELQAQIAALMAQLQALSGGSSASSAITSDLTVGSTGSQVVSLQQSLVSQGYLVMPAGVAYGYFGPLTKAATAQWQAAMGLPATGYFGPLSRAKFGGSVATGGTTTGGTTGAGSTGMITTPGMEGDITVTSAPVSNSTYYEGDDMAAVLAFKVEASGSDMAVQRVRVDLGTTSTLYRDIAEKIYLVDDAGRTLASADLNSSTVVRNADDEYEITLTGFSSVVAKGSTRTYTIKVDVASSIDSADIDTETYPFALSENGVRAIDGAGIDAFDPTLDSSVTKTITFSADLADSASLLVSTNGATPVAREIVAAAGANENEADRVVLLVFDIKAEKDDIEITDLKNFVVTAVAASSPATASSTYLYAGNGTSGAVVGTAAATASDVDFTDISYMIPANTTKTFTLAADVRSADDVQTTFDVSWTGDTTNVVGETSDGDTVSTVSGSAAANDVLVRNIGPEFSLVGVPTIVKGSMPVQNNYATSTAAATFNLRIKAVGTSITFGSNASSTYPMVSNGTGAPARSFVTYLAGASSNPAVASSTDFTVPSSGVTNDSANASFTLAEGNEVTIPVTFTLQGNLSTGVGITYGNYAVGLERINWLPASGSQSSSTFMASQTNWRTGSVSMP